MEVNYLKIIQCDLDSVSHSWGVPMMKITDVSILCEKTWKVGSVSNTYAPLYYIAKSIAAKYSWPNTNDLYIHYMDKSTGTPFFRREKGTSKLWQQN